MEKQLPYQLSFTEEARQMMDERMILVEDVIAVLNAMRETGEAIYDEEKQVCIARARVGNVTFWVAYTDVEGGFLVHRAWSHRMKIVPGNG